MNVTGFIRCPIDPYQREACIRYARARGRRIPRSGERMRLEGVDATRNQARQVAP